MNKSSQKSPSQKNLPLYREAQHFDLQRDTHGFTNIGLLWQKFFDAYPPDFSDPKTGKATFIAKIAAIRSNGRHLEAAHKRMNRLVFALRGMSFSAKNDWHFATGLGNHHPTENGLSFHHTIGVPFLPGSSVKGLLRAYMEWLLEGQPSEQDRERIKRWFGSESKETKLNGDASAPAGCFIFFDALPPAEVPKLVMDVMTPHMGKWYEDGGGPSATAAGTVPADWHSPVPVQFLATQKPTLSFAIAPRPSLSAEQKKKAETELPEAIQLLKEALNDFGAGAKTAVGYGRFDELP